MLGPVGAADFVAQWAAAHSANQVIEGQAVLDPQCLQLIDVNRIGQNPRRLLSQLCIPRATEHVNHVLLAELLLHHDHQARLSARRRRGAFVTWVAALEVHGLL
jgi:hypothetical protein